MSVRARVLIGLFILLGLIVIAPFALLVSGAYRNFYIPSEAMLPTLAVGDRFVARMSAPADLHRGDLLLVAAGNGSIYVKRLAGLPGDRIAVRGGIVLLNGREVPQRLLREDPVAPNEFGTSARRLAEQFPGEASPHEIYDSGDSQGDEFAEQIVAPGHVFVLGDNRDHSADSRFPHEEQGLEQVPLADVRGVPLFFTWTAGGRHGFGDGAGH